MADFDQFRSNFLDFFHWIVIFETELLFFNCLKSKNVWIWDFRNSEIWNWRKISLSFRIRSPQSVILTWVYAMRRSQARFCFTWLKCVRERTTQYSIPGHRWILNTKWDKQQVVDSVWKVGIGILILEIEEKTITNRMIPKTSFFE